MSGTREVKYLEKAKLKAQKSHDLRQEASLCNQLGEVLAKHGQFQEAIREHRLELQLSEVLGDVIGCAVANRKIGECLAEIGNYTGALEHQRRHLQLARSVANDIEEQRAWATIGRTYLYIFETDQSCESLKEAENAFRKSLNVVDERLEGKVFRHELSEMRARLYLNLGFLYDSLKDPVRCNHYIRKSVFIAEQNHLYEDLYRANFNLGSIHWRNGEHSKAVRCLEAAKECAKKMKEKYMESECFSSIGQVFLNLGDFVAAKRSLRKAFTLGSLQQSEHDSVRKNLKNAVKGSRLEEALSELPEKEQQQDGLGLCEQLGDLCCKVGSYRKAIDYYKMQLKYAEVLRKPDRELAVIHVSLATTFADLRDYEHSIEHYEAELVLRKGNPKEECKTWLNMALAKEEGGQTYGELEECYRNALRCAQQAQLPRLQLRATKLLHTAQEKMGHPEANVTLAQLEDLSEALGSESGDESEADEMENSESLEDSELELSDSDYDDGIEGYEKSVPGRRKINQWNRRNEKGETVLHRACIEGNLKHVQCLVEKGHPLNPRDYCGWTPLHEACNHGHLEIVRLLLDHQVNVNDPGGPHCEGITPLHDAINCGHFNVAELLIQKGASVTVRNAMGQTPLDSLHKWRQTYFKHLDQDTKQQCKHVEKLLKGSSNREVPPVQDFRESDLFDSESSQSLEPIESRVPPFSIRPVEAESRNYQRDLGGSCGKRQNLSAAPLTQGRVIHRLSQQHSCGTTSGPGIPLLSSTQMTAQNQLDCSALAEEESSEEDVPVEVFRPVKKQHGVIGQRSPADPGSAKTDGGQLAALTDDESSSQEEASEWHSPRTGQEGDLDIPSAGTSAYQRAIRNLGSAKSRILSQALAEPALNAEPPARKSALIPESEYVEDSWLEDDLGSGRPKKRSREHCRLGGANGSEEPSCSSEDELCPSSEVPESTERLTLQRKRSRQMRMTQIVDRAVVGRTRNQRGNARTIADTSVPRTSEIICATRVSTAPANSLISAQPFIPPVNSAAPPSIRVKVKVQEDIFLIPILHSDSEVRTVSWLAEQATQRYYQTCGLRPKLSLKKEGALLAPQDPIIHVLQNDEEVLAEVLSWDLPPLTDRYKRACDSLALAVNGLVLRVCDTQENSTCFRLSNLSLSTEHLTPILRALKLQTTTRQLCLSGNRLGDAAVDELLASLVTMPNLTLLDLSSNQITHEGLRKLCEPSAPSRESPFQSLEELNLSLNPLGDGSSQFIASLIRSCPLLSTLKLQACGLTAKFLQHYRLLLADAMKSAVHLKTLCLSHNALGSVGAELTLRNLPHHTITHLDIAAIVGTSGDTPLMEHLTRYLSQNDCCLTHLNLSRNRLTDDSVRDLSRCLLLCPSLVSLDVSANPGITTVGLEMLLAAVRERTCGIQYLNVSGSSVHGPSNTETVGVKLRELRLCSSRLNKYDKETLLNRRQEEAGCELHTVSSLRKCLIRAVPSSH
ncbi:tonsoku-like protein isoform X1 [Carcharodon carcharias]|uniref:tonsoku-like protein isoform X1 n=2 Tax=Carcharodon carcharias TaxID=13397 RepID=UPI001B7F4867|nr:tonsoku-like protein isoform X1 [Carcharodon carcharias]